jgi:hypothetical protein
MIDRGKGDECESCAHVPLKAEFAASFGYPVQTEAEYLENLRTEGGIS